MTTVKSILELKGNTAHHIDPNATIREALQVLADHNLGALLVMAGDKIEGIVSERDYALKVAATGNLCLDHPVKDIMSHPVYFISPEDSLDTCMALMNARQIRHLPVLEGNQLVGMISIRDLVRSIISEKNTTIKGLENYIIGRQIVY